MTAISDKAYRRQDTRFSKDGRTVFVTLRVDRQSYEFARSWAQFHAEADPDGTAEEQLEGYLNTALISHMLDMGWKPAREIKALYLAEDDDKRPEETEDGIPF